MSAPLGTAPLDQGDRVRRARRRLAAVLACALVLAVATAWLVWDNRRLVVTDEAVPVAELSDAGLRIAQVSDLHATGMRGFADRLVGAVDEAQPDLIAVTGDIVDVRTRDLTDVLALVDELVAIAPTVFVLGNHEADSPLRDELLAALDERGVMVLRDESAEVEIGGEQLVLVGLDDPRVRARDEAPRDIDGELLDAMDLPADAPVLLLAHRPERFDVYTGSGVDVVLSGHAHGGQVRLPLLGGLYAPHQGMFPRLTEGVHERDGTTMVISRGLGNSIASVRVNNPRELVIVDLVGS